MNQVMCRRFSLLCLFLATLLLSNQAFGQSIALTHVTVFDGTGAAPKPDQTILIQGSRIVAVTASAAAKLPKDAKIIDAHGKFATPGLWDMHVHLAGVSADPAWSKDVLLPLLIANGITGVRDMGGDLPTLLQWKKDIASGKWQGPHLIVSGPWLSDGGKPTPEQFPVTDEASARAAVRDLKQRGADFIKILTLPSREVFLAVADEARKQNIAFVGHLPLEVGALQASNAGMHSIEHLYYSAFVVSVSSKEQELRGKMLNAIAHRDYAENNRLYLEAVETYDPQKAAKLWETLKKNGTWVEPTLAAIYETVHLDPNAVGKGEVPDALAAEWEKAASDPGRKPRLEVLERKIAVDWKLTEDMHRAGVPLLVGSDSLDPGMIPGESLFKELNQLIRAGLAPQEVLVAATRDAAKFSGMEKDFGTIEAGKFADLVVFANNPLSGSAISPASVDAVILHGNYLDAQARAALKSRAASAAKAVK